jgi:DNA-binding transcriptional MerR regulator
MSAWTCRRCYCQRDLETLEQILALRFVGLSLSQIKTLLRRGSRDLAIVLHAQRTVLEQKKRLIDQAIAAIGQAEQVIASRGHADVVSVTRIIEVIQMQHTREEFKAQYDTLVNGKLERLKAMTPEARADLRAKFEDLFREIEQIIDHNPESPRAQELASRYMALLRKMAPDGDASPKFLKMAATFSSEGKWPASVPAPEPPFGGRVVWEFLARAACCTTGMRRGG